MPKVDAIAATSVKTAALTEDRKSMVFSFEVPSGEHSLAIPASQGSGLLRLLLTLMARIERDKKKDANVKYPIAADYWEIGTMENGDMIMTFVLPQGIEQSFRLRKEHGPDLIRVLNDVIKQKK